MTGREATRCEHGVDRTRVYCPPCGPDLSDAVITGRQTTRSEVRRTRCPACGRKGSLIFDPRQLPADVERACRECKYAEVREEHR